MAVDAGTIFAVSSGAGRAGIAVIRLSGPGALETVTSFTGLSNMPPLEVPPLHELSTGFST